MRLVRQVREGLTQLFDLPDGYEVVLGNGGTTAFWDAAIIGLVPRAQRPRQLRRVLREVRAGRGRGALPRDPVIAQAAPGSLALPTPPPDGVDVTRGRTTRPPPASWPRVQRAAQPDDALVLVDATSAAGGLPVDVSQTDVYYFARRRTSAGTAAVGGAHVA
jgi:phosphoserine aminotransferase